MRHSLCGHIAIGFVIAPFLMGCQQQQAPSDREARLTAAENIELKERLADQEKQLEAAQQRHTKELRDTEQELTRRNQRIEQLQKDVQEGIAQRVNDVTAKVMDENARLRKEIESLRADVEKLKAKARPAEPNQS